MQSTVVVAVEVGLLLKLIVLRGAVLFLAVAVVEWVQEMVVMEP
jgi:hypothetical protein